jgi:hypothetical protein
MKSNTYSLKERVIAIIIVLAVFGGFALWFYNTAGKDNLPNGDQIVCITRTGSKYHYASCSYLHSSSIEITLVEAVSRGYGRCSRCDPPGYISEEKYNEMKDSRSPVLLIILSLVITGFLWGILYRLIKELSGDWFIYVLFAIAYFIVLMTIYRWF